MTSFTIRHIRTLYASGLYHKADIFLRFINDVKSPDTLENILNYSVEPEIAEEFRLNIFCLPFIFEASEEYHHTLRAHAVEEHQRMLEDPKNAAATFEKCKNSATKKLDAKLKFVNSEFGTSFTTYDIQSRIHRT